MSSTQTLLGSVVFLLLAACSAGSTGTGGESSSGGNNGQGGSTGPGFNTTGGSTGSNVSNCTDPTCVGSTQQGECDTGLTIDSGDGMDGARAMGLCKVYSDGTWGVKSATWVRSDGQPLSGALLDGKGILSTFGSVTPREGQKMLVISSGSARGPNDPGYQEPSGYDKDSSNSYGYPPGYIHQESPACPGVTTGEPYDSAGLRVVLQTPTDAKSISFNFDFYTYEYPDYVCSQFNDFFVAVMSPPPAGITSGNISFDPQGNTISVNAGFLDQCTASMAGGKNFACSQGYSAIQGTGFDMSFGGPNTSFLYGIPGSGATGWLETKAPIDAPGSEITLQFEVWDSGDGVLDSTTLIDNFRFEASTTTTGTQPVPQ